MMSQSAEKFIGDALEKLITLDKEDDNSIHQKWNKYLTRGVLSRVVSSYVLPLITSEFGQDGNWNNKCPAGCEGNSEYIPLEGE